MDQGIVLSILGIIISVILGVWGIYLSLRHRYPGNITFVSESCIALFDSIVRNLPELSVQYKGNPVKENLVLLKGVILNDGKKDITPVMVEGKLQANLPDGYRWLAATVVAATPKVKAAVCMVTETSLEFDFGLFRRRESFRFEALAEVPPDSGGSMLPSDLLEKNLTFGHRIADTGRVISTVIVSESALKEFRLIMVALVIGLIVSTLLVLLGKPLEEGLVKFIVEFTRPFNYDEISKFKDQFRLVGGAILTFLFAAVIFILYFFAARLNRLRRVIDLCEDNRADDHEARR